MRCPHCDGHDLDPTRHDPQGMCTCSACGHRAFAGYVAEADSLAARADWLAERITAGDPAPAPELMGPYRVWPAPTAPVADLATAAGPPGTAPVAGPPAPASALRPAPSVQTILLGLGALLLIIAGGVFAAVVWDRLGALGQVALMLAATLGIGALAIRLRRGLTGTAEALAAVAAGLGAIDVMAAPLLGLLPEHWIQDPTIYPALALAALGAALLLLQARFGLRAWSWLGWLGVLAGTWCVVPAVASATADLASNDWVAASIVVPTLASIAMLAAGQAPRSRTQRAPLMTVGGCGLLLAALGTAAAATEESSTLGALVTTAAAAIAMTLWASRDSDRSRLVDLGAAALAGVTVSLVLSLPPDPQPVWLAAAAALAGLVVGLVLWLLGCERITVAVGACAVWLPWAFIRTTRAPIAGAGDDLVSSQLSLLALLIGLVAFALAWWNPGLGWVGAVLEMVAMGLAPVTWADTVEAWSLPFAALLLAAGLLWRRRGPTPSVQWLGPAVALALIPSALAAWSAPWALDLSGEAAGIQLARLGVVLLAGVGTVIVGARMHLAGLLLPGAAALIVAGGAQIWGGLESLPRWIALAVAGTLLVMAGARIEWLRTSGRRVRAWAEDLD